MWRLWIAVLTLLWAVSTSAEPPKSWPVHIQQLTGKGPDEFIEVEGWRPLSFFAAHRPVLDFGPKLDWQPLDAATTRHRALGTLDGLQVFELVQELAAAEPWQGKHRLLVLAGPDESRLRPVHVLISSDEILRTVWPVELVEVGEDRGISVRYDYTGMGGHRGWHVYVTRRGRPVDLRIQEVLLAPLPLGVADGWKRSFPLHHRWMPPEWETHPFFDLATLRGHVFLSSKTDDRLCWFDVTYSVADEGLRVEGAELSDCPRCDESCRAGFSS